MNNRAGRYYYIVVTCRTAHVYAYNDVSWGAADRVTDGTLTSDADTE